MGVPSSSSAGQGPPRVRSIRSHLAARLAIPVVCLVALCGLAIGVAFGGPLAPLRFMGSGSPQQHALAEAGALAGATLVVAVLTVVLVAAYARRLSREISDLTEAARNLATEQLPRVVRELRQAPADSGASAAQTRRALEAQWLAARATRTAEIAAAVNAITSIERAAVDAATAEARLRDGLRQILMSLGRRNQSLLHRQLKIIDHLEQQAVSPGELADLFALDHLTTRMRRHAESLTILSGAAPVRSWSAPVPVIDVIRAAVAEIEDYKRVSVITEADESVAASAVTDMIHLLAELIENATLFSPSATRVEVRAERVANGFAIEVEDRGLGIAAEQLREINGRLATPPDFDLADADRLGLFVAGRLATRHGVQVELIPSAYRGTRAVVILPDTLVTTEKAEFTSADSVLRGAARLNVQSPEALSLVGATASRPLVAVAPVGSTTSAPLSDPVVGDPARWEDLADQGEELPRRGELPSRGDLPRREPPAAAPSAGEHAQAQAQDTVRRLPRRVRPGSPEQLAIGTPVRMPGAVRPAEAPAPERARNLAASLQSSWQRSREADHDTPDTDLGTPGGAPDSEEKLWLTATEQAGPSLATSPGSLMTWRPGLKTFAGRCCCPGTGCSSPRRRTCPARTRSTCRQWPPPCSPWPRGPGSASTPAGYGRRSSSSRRGCFSSPRRARAVALPRFARRPRTRASSRTRWRCW
jgi:signal transduction histidine kinase